MIRLNLKSEPEWLELLPGLRVLVAPARTALLEAARAEPEVEALRLEDAPEVQLAVPFTKAVARLAILEWEGVADADGEPVPVSAEAVDALLDVHPVYVAWHEKYTAKWAALGTEKNGSSLLPSGTSAGATTIAGSAKPAAKSARKKSTGRKR